MSFTYDQAQKFLSLRADIESITSEMYGLILNGDLTTTQKNTMTDALDKVHTASIQDVFCATIGHIVEDNWDGYTFCGVCEKDLPNKVPRTLVPNVLRLRSTITGLEGASTVDTPAPTLTKEPNPSNWIITGSCLAVYSQPFTITICEEPPAPLKKSKSWIGRLLDKFRKNTK